MQPSKTQPVLTTTAANVPFAHMSYSQGSELKLISFYLQQQIQWDSKVILTSSGCVSLRCCRPRLSATFCLHNHRILFARLSNHLLTFSTHKPATWNQPLISCCLLRCTMCMLHSISLGWVQMHTWWCGSFRDIWTCWWFFFYFSSF